MLRLYEKWGDGEGFGSSVFFFLSMTRSYLVMNVFEII